MVEHAAARLAVEGELAVLRQVHGRVCVAGRLRGHAQLVAVGEGVGHCHVQVAREALRAHAGMGVLNCMQQQQQHECVIQ